MCDETALAKWAKSGAGGYAQGGLSRRNFAALSGAAALAACTRTDGPMGGSVMADPATAALSESAIGFATRDGRMDGFFVHPDEGKHPAVILWPDIAGLREANRDMARRLAGEGYAVVALNPYYRDVVGEQFADFASFAGNDGFAKVKPWRDKLSADAVMRDAAAAVAWLDAQGAVDTAKGIGAEGYCMGGPFTVYSASAVPSRVKAAASFHGGGLVRDDAQSPHKLLAGTQASYLIAIAKNDDEKAPGDKVALRKATDAAGRPAVVEVFAGDHGWTVPDSPAYDEAAAERAYAAKMRLYRAAL